MIWLIFGIFYLLLVCFFIGAFALSRRADDNASLVEEKLTRNNQHDQALKIHRLYKTEAAPEVPVVNRPQSEGGSEPARRLAS